MDYASGTPADGLGNPGGLHKEGLVAKKILEDARIRVARVLGARPREIIFTSSGTEANNLAILGIVSSGGGRSSLKNSKRPDLKEPIHIIITNIEHSSILETCKYLENPPAGGKQAKVTYVPVEKNGIVDPDKIKKALRPNTVLVSVMYANNEIGTIQPIREIAKIIRHFRKIKTGKRSGLKNSKRPDLFPVFHTDAVQAANYLDIRPEFLGVDLLTLNSSKIYGPQGVGMLYARTGVKLKSIFHGGDQEFGLRPGTENIIAISGFARALEIAQKIREKESARLTKLRDYFIKASSSKDFLGPRVASLNQTLENLPKTLLVLNGDLAKSLPNIVNISIPNIESEMLVLELDAYGIAVSSKSACKSSDEGESHVIRALRSPGGAGTKEGLPAEALAKAGSLRISLGRSTTKSDIDYLLKSLRAILLKLTGQKLWY